MITIRYKGVNILNLVAAFIAAAIFLNSCSKDSIIDTPQPPSDSNLLRSLKVETRLNPSLKEDCSAFINGDIVYITLSEGASLKDVKITFSLSPKAELYIGSSKIAQGGSADISASLLKVRSESGKERSYKLLAKNGNSRIDNTVLYFMQRYSLPGASISISKDERSVYSAGLGFADTEKGTRVAPGMLFRLASISKQFTCFTLLRLVEQGRVGLDDKVFGAGGILANEFPTVSERAAKVTIRHLLSNISGWVSNPDPMFTASFKGQSLDERISYVLSSPQSEPATKYSYFNMGFGIVGRVIEKVTGKGFESVLKGFLAEGGITDIHVGGTKSERRSNEVVYYSQDGTNGYGNEMDIIAAAGGLIASSDEMIKYLCSVDGGSVVPDILQQSSIDAMSTPSSVNNRYGLAWMMNHPYFPGCRYHTGNLAGTAVMWVTGNGLNVVVLFNSRSYISGFDDELYGLLKELRSIASEINW